MIKPTIILLTIALLINCKNSNHNSNQPTGQIERSNHDAPTVKTDTVSIPLDDQYSPSQIDELIAKTLEHSSEIDTLEELQQIDCGKLFDDIGNFQLTPDTVNSHTKFYEISRGLKAVLNATSCFKKIKESANYDAYIFLTDEEAHFSKAFKLVTINQLNHEIHQVDLSYLYGNEQGNKTVKTVFESATALVRTSRIHHQYIHGIGAVDSIEIRKEYFSINEQGK